MAATTFCSTFWTFSNKKLPNLQYLHKVVSGQDTYVVNEINFCMVSKREKKGRKEKKKFGSHLDSNRGPFAPGVKMLSSIPRKQSKLAANVTKVIQFFCSYFAQMYACLLSSVHCGVIPRWFNSWSLSHATISSKPLSVRPRIFFAQKFGLAS